MGFSKTDFPGLALSILQLIQSFTHTNLLDPSTASTLVSRPVFSSSEVLLSSSSQISQDDDDRNVALEIRQHRIHELADMRKRAEQRWEANHQKTLAALQDYTKLPAPTISFIDQESTLRGVPLPIVLGLMEQESSFCADAVNPQTGAVGLGQLEQPTAHELASRGGFDDRDLHDPIINARLAISYLNQLHKETGSWDATLTAYNRGLSGLHTYQRLTGTSISDYSSGVMQKARQIEALLQSE